MTIHTKQPRSPIGVFKFSKSAVNAMKDLTQKTKQTKLEHGGMLCADLKNRKITLDNVCTGTECKIMIEGKCPNDKYYAGIFHTHPETASLLPSAKDLTITEMTGTYVDCIGAPSARKKSKLQCYTFKFEALTPERIKQRRKLLKELYDIEKKKTKTIFELDKYMKQLPKLVKNDMIAFDPTLITENNKQEKR